MKTSRSLTAQVAVEAIADNVEAYDPETIQAVLGVATTEEVPKLYMTMLRRQLCDACQKRPLGHGHFGRYCEPCAELPYGQAAK